MESRPLRYFVAVARAESFTRAAERLGIAQPPLSRGIAKLERDLGATLFDRRHGLRLTEAGRVLLEQVEPALALIDAAPARVAATTRAAAAVLTVGFVAAAAYELLPRLSGRFRAACPDAELRIVGMTNGEQVDALASGAIDIGLAWLPFERGDLVEVPLLRDGFLAALPVDHPLASRTTLSADDLRGEALVIGCRTPRIERAIERALGWQPGASMADVVRRVRDLGEAIDCVAAGLGVTLVPGSMRGERGGRVAYRTFESSEPLLIGAVYRARPVSSALERFLACNGIGSAD